MKATLSAQKTQTFLLLLTAGRGARAAGAAAACEADLLRADAGPGISNVQQHEQLSNGRIRKKPPRKSGRLFCYFFARTMG